MKTTIEINGKLYDAKTGRVIEVNANKPKANHPPAGMVMDGVARRKVSSPTNLAPKPKPKPQVKPTIRRSSPFAQDVMRPKHSTHNNAHKAVNVASKSVTLNRKAVKKPTYQQKPKITAKSPTPNSTIHSKVEQSATGRGLLLKKVPETRILRSLKSPKSNLISKFGKNSSTKPQLSPHLKVSQAPSSTQAKATSSSSQSGMKLAMPHAEPANNKPSVFEDHLVKANSQSKKSKRPARQKHRGKLRLTTKLASFGIIAFAFVLLGGFLVYQNVPSVGIKIAANRAGFDGKLPGNIPAGYGMSGPIEAESKNIVVNYKSKTDNRQFTLTQKPTNWSSESLLTNYLLDSQFRYQVYRDKGLTVYIYNGSNATWVDKGIWYSVTSQDESLSSEQLLQIASSI